MAGFCSLPRDVLKVIVWLLDDRRDVLSLRLGLPRCLGVDSWIWLHPCLEQPFVLAVVELQRGIECFLDERVGVLQRRRVRRTFEAGASPCSAAVAHAGLRWNLRDSVRRKARFLEVPGLPCLNPLTGAFWNRNIFESLSLLDDETLLGVGYDVVVGPLSGKSWSRCPINKELGCHFACASVEVANDVLVVGTDINTFELFSLRNRTAVEPKGIVWKSASLRGNVRRLFPQVGAGKFLSLGVFGLERWDLDTQQCDYITYVESLGGGLQRRDKFYDAVNLDAGGSILAVAAGKMVSTVDLRLHPSKSSVQFLSESGGRENNLTTPIYTLAYDRRMQTLVCGGTNR